MGFLLRGPRRRLVPPAVGLPPVSAQPRTLSFGIRGWHVGCHARPRRSPRENSEREMPRLRISDSTACTLVMSPRPRVSYAPPRRFWPSRGAQRDPDVKPTRRQPVKNAARPGCVAQIRAGLSIVAAVSARQRLPANYNLLYVNPTDHLLSKRDPTPPGRTGPTQVLIPLQVVTAGTPRERQAGRSALARQVVVSSFTPPNFGAPPDLPVPAPRV